ncbi:hypothetical protein H5T58_01905 [Candidatus Parcubacteria bacterium]|nr:hypothetical protein [Candidatus Parcubacteria bacterium]
MGILDRLNKILNPPPKPKSSPKEPLTQRSLKFASRGMTQFELKNWLWKDRDVLREVFQNSPSKREQLWNALQEYWPQGQSLKRTTLYQIKQRVARDKMFGETVEMKKRAMDVEKLLQFIEKKFTQ